MKLKKATLIVLSVAALLAVLESRMRKKDSPLAFLDISRYFGTNVLTFAIFHFCSLRNRVVCLNGRHRFFHVVFG